MVMSEILRSNVFSSLCILCWSVTIGQRQFVGNEAYPEHGLVFVEYNETTNTTEFFHYDVTTGDERFLTQYFFREFILADALERFHTIVGFDKKNKEICYMIWHDATWYHPVCSRCGDTKGLAVDDVSGKVYWSDDTNKAIYMANVFNLNMVHVIADTDIHQPGNVVVYPETGFVFWTDSGLSQGIERAELHGGGRIKLYDNPGYPSHLTLNKNENRLYWFDEVSEDIKSCDIYGMGYRRPFNNPRAHLTSITWYQGLIYARREDGQQSGIMELNVNTGTRTVSLVKPLLQTIVSIETQTCHSQAAVSLYDRCREDGCPFDQCVTHKFNCSHPELTNHSCHCQQRPVLSNSVFYIECAEPRDIYGSLILATDTGLLMVPHSDVIRHVFDSPVPLYSNENIKAVVSDVLNKKLFVFKSDGWISEINLLSWDIRPVTWVPCTVKRMQVDWMSRNLYWITDCSANITVSVYSGRYWSIVVSLAHPRDFTIDPIYKKIFWINNLSGELEMSSLSGENRVTIPCSGQDCNSMTTLALDIQLQKLIVYETANRVVSLVDYISDPGRWTYLFSSDVDISIMSIVHGYIVFISREPADEMTFVDKLEGTLFGRYNISNVTFNGIALYHTNRPSNIGPCSRANGDCSQICLPTAELNSRQCVCNYVRGQCRRSYFENSFVLVADQGGPALYQYRLSTGDVTTLSLIGLGQPYAVGFDGQNQKVYWSDFTHKTLNRANLNGQFQEVILAQPNLYIFDICILGHHGIGYFADSRNGRILVMSLETLKYTTLYQHQSILGFGLDIVNGYIYVTRHYYGNDHSLIRINMDGTGEEVSINTTLFRSTHLVANSQSLYVITSGSQRIARLDVNGTTQYDIVRGAFGASIHGIAMAGDNILWTNRNTTKVYSRNKYSDQSYIEEIDFQGRLYSPAGLVYFEYPEEPRDCTIPCDGICVPNGHNFTCLTATTDQRIVAPRGGFCVVPNIENGRVANNRVGAAVVHGTHLTIACYPAHRLSPNDPLECLPRGWSHTERCNLTYRIYGDKTRGCTVFRSSGSFFIYDTMAMVSVVVVGGGGGGFGNTMSYVSRAGDGGDSIFNSTYPVRAAGGRGGNFTRGGTGNAGSLADGCPGHRTSRGGSRGGNFNWTAPDIQEMIQCSDVPLCSNCGDGGMSSRGGSGSSGAVSALVVNVRNLRNKVVDIVVGQKGDPSAFPPGNGVVVIKWGFQGVFFSTPWCTSFPEN